MPNQRAGQTDEAVALQVDLVSVDRKETLPRVGVLEDQPAMGGDPILHHTLVSTSLDVVVADNQVKPPISIESVEQIEDAIVSGAYLLKMSMLPEFIAVPHLHVGVPLVVVSGQDAQEERLVLGESVGSAVVATMTVAEENEGRSVVEGSPWSRLVRFRKALVKETRSVSRSGLNLSARRSAHAVTLRQGRQSGTSINHCTLNTELPVGATPRRRSCPPRQIQGLDVAP